MTNTYILCCKGCGERTVFYGEDYDLKFWSCRNGCLKGHWVVGRSDLNGS